MSEGQTPNVNSLGSNTYSTSFTSDNTDPQIQSTSRPCLSQSNFKEIHYVPYNTSTSLTLYSHALWRNHVLVATKENNFKELYFRHSKFSLVSKTASRPCVDFDDNTINEDDNSDSGNELQLQLNETTTLSDDSITLEPVVKIHRLSKVIKGALISSIDVVDMNEYCAISVAFTQRRKHQQQQHQLMDAFYLHVYCDFETNDFDLVLDECKTEFELETLAHNVTNLIYLDKNDTKQNMILVNCNQRRNLLFQIDAKNCQIIKLDKIEEYFCEYDNMYLPHNVTCNDMKYLENKTKRLTAIGCQNGFLFVSLVDVSKNEILKSFEFENDSFVTNVKLFTTKTHQNWSKLDLSKIGINLLVLRSLEPARIFKKILSATSLVDDYQDLDCSHNYDLVTSSVIYDAQFTGVNTIILGTFGKCLLIYCYNETDDRYELRRGGDLIMLKHSIMGLSTCNLTFNGSNDLIIFTLNGIHVCQYEPELVISLINQKYAQNEALFDNYLKYLTSIQVQQQQQQQNNNEVTKL